MKYIFFLLIAVFLHANIIGEVVYKQGIVKVKNSQSIVKKSIFEGYKIKTGDKIYTYNSKAKIVLNDGSVIKLSNNSILEFAKKLVQVSGKVYYQIKHKKLKTFKIATKFTTIGVKGTIFVVDANEKLVALKKGIIDLISPKGEYRIHKLKDEFEMYKNKLQQEFEEYKKQLEKEFVEFKKTFTIKSNTMVIFKGQDVYEKKLDPAIFKEFESF